MGRNKIWEGNSIIFCGMRICVIEGFLLGYVCRFLLDGMDTLEGELRDESKDGVEAELALEKKFLEIFTQK